jgi:hypothetical protein
MTIRQDVVRILMSPNAGDVLRPEIAFGVDIPGKRSVVGDSVQERLVGRKCQATSPSPHVLYPTLARNRERRQDPGRPSVFQS